MVGLEYEEYCPFNDGISYESYEAVEKRRRWSLFAGIAAALVIGALVTVAAVVLTGGAALGVLAVGFTVAGVGSAASAVTYMRDKENSAASSMGTYIRNSGTASFITAFTIASFWAAPYAGKVLALQETGGLPFTMLFGNLITVGELADWMTIGTQGFALWNAFFQTNELLAFFGGTKELGEDTGCAVYDDVKLLTEAYNTEFLFMGVGQWWKKRQLQKFYDSLSSKYKGQEYKGSRNPDMDFVNNKGKSTLGKHAGKHGYNSLEEYLKDARNFLEKQPTTTTQSFVSSEGTYFRYDTETNEFGIINQFGGISTYFKPEEGMAYWLEQIEKYAPK